MKCAFGAIKDLRVPLRNEPGPAGRPAGSEVSEVPRRQSPSPCPSPCDLQIWEHRAPSQGRQQYAVLQVWSRMHSLWLTLYPTKSQLANSSHDFSPLFLACLTPGVKGILKLDQSAVVPWGHSTFQ